MVLANRLRKRQRHLRKWAKRHNITCYRLYERDIPEYPLIVDWYDGEVVVWLYGRSKDETAVEMNTWRETALRDIQDGLDVTAKQLYIKERVRQRGLSEQYERTAKRSEIRIANEKGLRFELNLSDYLDTGLFLDHRNTRDMVRQRAKGKRVLNLFAYTGSFSCYAAAGGATKTTTVDISRTYCDWAARNLELNGFGVGAAHQVLAQDCLRFLKEAARQRHRYDIIVCDPPTFSNSKRMAAGSFAVDRDHPQLIRDCVKLLSPGGELFFSNNSRKFKLQTGKLPTSISVKEITDQTVPEDFRNKRIHRCWLMVKERKDAV
ncbi:MAG: methyltransferase [Chloroflexi bacterium]|nr:methyltransferase [Chloroflexota bacterium]